MRNGQASCVSARAPRQQVAATFAQQPHSTHASPNTDSTKATASALAHLPVRVQNEQEHVGVSCGAPGGAHARRVAGVAVPTARARGPTHRMRERVGIPAPC